MRKTKTTALGMLVFVAAAWGAARPVSAGQSTQATQVPQGSPSAIQAPSNSGSEAKRTPRIRFGGLFFGMGYSRYSRGYPGWLGHYYSPYYYDPFLCRPSYSPYSGLGYHPGWFTGFSRQSGMGEVQLKTQVREASVFLDGAFAGLVKDLSRIWLEPGAYNLRLVAQGIAPFELRIYVLSGKTLKVTPWPAQRVERSK